MNTSGKYPSQDGGERRKAVTRKKEAPGKARKEAVRRRPRRNAEESDGHSETGPLPAGFDEASQRGPEGREQAPLLPGVKPVLELLREAPERVDAVFLRKGRHSADMTAIVDACRAAGVRFSLLDPASFSRLYAGNSQGVAARLFEAGFADLDSLFDKVMDAPLPLILMLDQVQDPGNAGTLARTLYALGGAGMIIPRHNGVYLGAAASKAAAGALERLPVTKAANLGQAVDSAKKLGFTIYGAAAAPSPQKVSLPDNARHGKEKETPARALPILPVLDAYNAAFRLPALLILGSEESGIRPGLEKRCDYLVSIPMLRDFDSLNVAQAGGIIISCFARDIHGK